MSEYAKVKRSTIIRISYLMILFCLVGTACKREEDLPAPVTYTAAEIQDRISKLTARREVIKNWATTCKDFPNPGRSYLNGITENRDGTCYQWDMNQRAGMGCIAATLAGDADTVSARCRDVITAQTPDGRWFRGASRIQAEKDKCDSHNPDCPELNAFSRDALMGMVGYWTATRLQGNPNRSSAVKWLEWVNAHRGMMCDRADDNRCQIMPDTWSLLGQVWRVLGLTPNTEMKNNADIYGLVLPVANPPIGFELALLVDGVFVRRLWNQFDSDPRIAATEKKILDQAAQKAYQLQPLNPYFDFIANGVSDPMIDRLLTYCPVIGPQVNVTDWAWQRDTTKRAWEISMGHDCIFLMNLVIHDLKARL